MSQEKGGWLRGVVLTRTSLAVGKDAGVVAVHAGTYERCYLLEHFFLATVTCLQEQAQTRDRIP